MTFTEKKMVDMEHHYKKKLEELAAQIKVYVPINFNPYSKNYESGKVPHINVENLFPSENVKEQLSVNVMDSANAFKNFDLIKNTDLVGKKKLQN